MTADARDAAVRFRGVNVRYGAYHVLKNVSAIVPPRAVTALIGPSGCGKTTLLRCINRLNERHPGVAITGAISVFGKNVHDPDVSLGELRKRVGMVFQRPNPLPVSVFENVAFGLRVHAARALRRGALDDEVESALRQATLWSEVKDRLDERATRLSLAQQQKLCLARLLPLKPDVILMDEPCSALDAADTAAIERLVRRLKEAYTILIVTHNMAQARRASDHCLFMLLGEVIETGTTADLFLHPARKETQFYVDGRYA
jgi:phosphate transport system ATP-binding protein